MKKQIAGQRSAKRSAKAPKGRALVPARAAKAAPPMKGSEAALAELAKKIEHRWGREIRLEADQLRETVREEHISQLEGFLNTGAQLLRIRKAASTAAKSTNEGETCVKAIADYAGMGRSTAHHRMRIAARFGSDPKVRQQVLMTGALPSALLFIDQAIPNDNTKALQVLKATAGHPIAEIKLELAAMQQVGSTGVRQKTGGRTVNVPTDPKQAVVFFEKQLAAFSSRTSRAFADTNIDDLFRALDDEDQFAEVAEKVHDELKQIEEWCAQQRERLVAFIGDEAEDEELEAAADEVLALGKPADEGLEDDDEEEDEEAEEEEVTSPPLMRSRRPRKPAKVEEEEEEAEEEAAEEEEEEEADAAAVVSRIAAAQQRRRRGRS